MATRTKKLFVVFVFSCCLLALGSSLFAFPIATSGEGFKIFASSTDNIIAEYLGNSASYSNDLYLDNGDGTWKFIFNNQATPVGTTLDLGSFEIGTELIFKLYVNNTGYAYYTGPAERNPDNYAHARVQSDWQLDTTLVSFEDLYNGPFDYNDLSFSFTNTIGGNNGGDASTVPEPSTMILLGGSLLGLAWYRRSCNRG